MYYFLDNAFWKNPVLILLFGVTLLLIVFLRYLFFAWGYQAVLRRVRPETPDIYRARAKQIRSEIRYAFLSSCIFTVIAAFCLYLWHNHWTGLYSDARQYPLWYLPVSGFMVILLYETYYYWLHRWMHRPGIFRKIHKVHHQSIHPTVFTAFSFHPLEALLQFLFFPIVLVLIPLHYKVLVVVLMLFTLSALINHSGVEVYRSRWMLKNIIGAGHHDVHHKFFHNNFGLMLTWWDRVMGTERSGTPSDTGVRPGATLRR